MWKGRSKRQLAQELGFDLFHFGIDGTSLETPLSDTYCEKVKDILPKVDIRISSQREGQKTVIERTFRTPKGPLHDVLVMPDAGGEYGMNPNHEWLEPLVKTCSDAELLAYLLPAPACIKRYLKQAHRVENELGDAGLVAFRPTIGVDQIAVDALGVAQAMIVSLDKPELLDHILEIVDSWHMRVMRLVLEDGWRIIFDAWFNFSLSVGWSPTFYRRTVSPLIKNHADLIHNYGARMFFYDDGKLAKSIGAIIESGADIIQTLTPPPTGDLDFRWLAETHGGKACLNGGIDTVKIRFGRAEEIAQDVRDVIDALAPTGKFILGTSDSITEGPTDENIHALFYTAREYGTLVAKKLYG